MAEQPQQEKAFDRAKASSSELLQPVDSAREVIRPSTGARSSLLRRLPWERALVWGLILLGVYMVRSFFFTIFMTFIISYIMRSIVLRIQRVVTPYRERVWLERALTLAFFVLLLLGLYEVGKYFYPRLEDQGKTLVTRVSQIDYGQEWRAFLNRTWGSFLFASQYGGENDPGYKEEFEQFKKKDVQVIVFDQFGQLRVRLWQRFDAEVLRPTVAFEIQSELASGEINGDAESEWFRTVKAPGRLVDEEEEWFARYEDWYRANSSDFRQPPWSEHSRKPDFAPRREEWALNRITREWNRKPEERSETRREWEDHLIDQRVAERRNSPEGEQEFADFYARLSEGDTEPTLHDYATYLQLNAAFDAGTDAFRSLLQELNNLTDVIDPEELIRRQHAQFRADRQQKLTDKWLNESEFAGTIKERVDEYVNEASENFAAWFQNLFRQTFKIVTGLSLALLLSLFITLDIPKMRTGLRKMEESRLRNFYAEVAPGMINFGRLIGRAFLAQGVIALCNTILTFLAIQLLGIQNEYFLCAIVFLCSFIPVVGVVLSSAPIAVMAVLQPDGSVWLALQAIVAILIIHFIETSLLNPKIIGDMLHLHPALVLTVLAVGQHFFGVWGLLLGVPVAVYIIRFVILNEGIPGFIEPVPPSPSLRSEPERAVLATEGGHAEVKLPTGASSDAGSRLPSATQSVGDAVSVGLDAPQGEDETTR